VRPLLRLAAPVLLGTLLLSFSTWAPSAFGAAASGPGSAANRTASRPVAPTVIKINGVSYTDARAWFARLGYKSVFDADRRVLTLSAAAGQIVLEGDSRETSLHGLRVFLGEPVALHKGALFVSNIDLDRFLGPILHPAQLAARPLRTLVIDPGHGGQDTGTQNKPGKLDEKVFALDVAKRLRRLLADSDPSLRVLLTREDDRFVALPARAEFANEAKADLFISIHFNAVANNPSVRGTETYVLTPRFQRSTSSQLRAADDKVLHPGNRHDAWSAVLGAHMHRQLLGKLKTQDRGYKRARFAVLRLVDCPAVLVEAGYLSNDSEARLIATPEYRGDIAEALAAAVRAYSASLASAKD
jgi:N-acetylmuramoyl-L-alanine amidase